MADPAWPPNLLLLRGTLLEYATVEELNLILYEAPLSPLNDEQLASVRVTQGSNMKDWQVTDQAAWIMRRPMGEWLFYVRDRALVGLFQPSYLSPLWAL